MLCYADKLKKYVLDIHVHTYMWQTFYTFSQAIDYTNVLNRIIHQIAPAQIIQYIVGCIKVQKSGPAIHEWLLYTLGVPRARKNV